MKRHHVIWLVLGASLAALVTWIVRNTYWEEVTLPATLRGDAARYPLYAAEMLAKQLGARTSRHSVFPAAAADSVIYLSDWTWDLGNVRRREVERWVESGGRLVVDNSVYIQQDIFQRWSGIEFYTPRISADERKRRASEEK